MKTDKTLEKANELREMLGEIETNVLVNYTLADAIREGSKVSKQAQGWGAGEEQCALHAAVTAAIARGHMGA
jgi:hypothetical protein